MERTRFANMHCSMARALDLIGDWWSPLILRDLFLGVRRFDELVEDLGISRNLLTRRLSMLVERGVIAREVYQDRPPRYEYRLTEAGADLIPVLMALTAWGDRWSCPPKGPPIRFIHTGCRHPFQPQIVCSECGDVVRPEHVHAVPGPGAAPKAGTKMVARVLMARTGRS